MKRIISLILTVALILSIAILPAAANDKPDVELDVVSFTDDGNTFKEVAPGKESYSKGDKIAVRIRFVNDGTERYLSNYDFFVSYDATALKPYTFTSGRKTIGPAVSPDASAMVESKQTEIGKVLIKGINFNVTIPANETATLAWIMFTVENETGAEEVETAAYDVSLYGEDNEIGFYIEDVDFAPIEGIAYNGKKTQVSVNGVAPTIGKVTIAPNATTGYASGEEFTLSAESGSGKDITSFVSFKIQKEGTDYPANAGLTIDGAKLKVESTGVLANAGTYTVVAVPNGSDCTGSESAEFTITQKTITAPTVTIVGFGKGVAVGDVKYSANDLNAVPLWYEGEGDPSTLTAVSAADKFKADTTYTLVLTLTPANDNYVLDSDTTVTVKNFGEERTVALNSGVAVIAAKTADKDEPTLDLKDLSATYGDKLLNLKLDSCSASFNGQPVEGTFAWADEYNAETPVGDAGEQTFNVVFTPAQQEVYATVTGTVKVNVAKKQITFTKSDYEWKSINDDPYTLDDYKAMCFQYDKNEHGIEPTCTNNDISDLVEFEVSSNNKSTNVIAATVTAKVLLKDEYAKNYKFDKDNTNIQSATLKVLPIVVEGTGEYTHSVEVCYTTSSVDIPLSEFGLPDEVLNDTNNKYWMRTDAVVAGDVDVISGTPTSFDEANRTLTLNLKSSLTKDDAGKTASVTLGLKVNNYETTNPGVEEIAGGEDKLFILKLNVKIIEKENAGLTITGIPESLVYGESAEWSYNVTKPGENGNISGSVTPAGILNNDPYKLTAIGVGEATVTITYSSDTTYAQEKFTITVTPKPLTAAVSHDPITYGDPTPTEGYTVTFNGLLTGDVLADTDYTVGTEYKQGDPVGKYAFTCVLNSETVKNYKLDTVNGELVVNKKELTDGDVTVTVLGETPVYDGSEKKPAVEVKYGETTLAAADYTVSYSNNVNAGVNTASVTVTSNDNSSYKFTATKNFTIAQAPISGAMIANIPSVTYNTRAHTPEVTVRFNGSKLTDADYTVSYSEDCINAGTVTVTVTGKGNFTGTASKTFTINKAGLTLNPCTISELCTETDLKTRTLPSDFFLAGETETGFSIKLTAVEGGDDIFAVAPAVVEGENKITFRLKNEVGAATFTVTVTPVSGNYNGGSYALTISTHDRTDVSGSISFPDGSAVYTGTGIKYENATISGYSGTLRYGYTPNASTGASLDASGLPLTVGTYTVAVTFNSDASFGYKTATFTITKATPTGTPGYTKLETSGKTLADAKLTVGTIRPAGTIAWDLPLTTVLEDGKAYAWTFTPNDTHNYAILTGTLVPYVDDGMDYIPGVIGGNTGSFNFHDVSRFDYFYDAVKWAAENGIASGTGRYTFSPNAVCTRAQTVTFLWRAAGSPLPRYRVCPFTDVQPSDYYYNAVLWAVEQGITTGLNANTFGPDVTVTRGQVATFLYRAASAAKPSTFNPFTDVKTTAYNYGAILWAYDNRITTGTSDTTFSPDAYCTRAQIVTFLYRYYQGR